MSHIDPRQEGEEKHQIRECEANCGYWQDNEGCGHYEQNFAVDFLGDQLVAKKKNEKFKRIKGSTLAKYLQEVTQEESVFALAEQAENL